MTVEYTADKSWHGITRMRHYVNLMQRVELRWANDCVWSSARHRWITANKCGTHSNASTREYKRSFRCTRPDFEIGVKAVGLVDRKILDPNSGSIRQFSLRTRENDEPVGVNEASYELLRFPRVRAIASIFAVEDPLRSHHSSFYGRFNASGKAILRVARIVSSDLRLLRFIPAAKTLLVMRDRWTWLIYDLSRRTNTMRVLT